MLLQLLLPLLLLQMVLLKNACLSDVMGGLVAAVLSLA
jgi:hypothetical protein